MVNMADNPLKKILDSNLYARYSGILSLSDISLFLTDMQGDILVELIPSPDFCSHVCLARNGKICSDYQSRLTEGYEGTFTCRHGLENILLPLKAREEILGYIGGMQVYSQDSEYKKFMIDIHSFKEPKVELEFIAKSIASLKNVDPNKLKVHEHLCRHIANNISLDLSEKVTNVNPHLARLSVEKEMLEKKIIDLEAKNMSLVINPHFLFNTLNCIARIAYFEKSYTTEELIYCLSDLLRYNLKQTEQLHTIASEIDNIEKYLYIQKARFKSRLDYEIQVPEMIKSCRIPNMVIQPIVENAIIHGITAMRDGGKINIHAEKRRDDIIIYIADNGNGFPQDVIEKIKQKDEKTGLGYRSTDKRLKQYYGECYGLEIVKSDYSGSTVSITIPTQPMGGAKCE